jgi:hypothetical protein
MRFKMSCTLKFQIGEEYVRPIPGMIYWFTYGKMEFDIRELREKIGLKKEYAVDMDFKKHRCTAMHEKFEKIVNKLNGENFEELIKSLPSTYLKAES